MALSVGNAANAEVVLLLLRTVKQTQAMLPLVLQTDNGGAYCSTAVQEYLAAERVVHLRSRPRRPTDNGAAEIGMRELKEETGLGRGVRLPAASAAALRLARMAQRLNEHRLRGSRGYLTSQALGRMFPPWYKKVARVPFYEEVTTAMAEAREGLHASRARLAERQAAFAVLEKHGLVVTTRGGRSPSPPKCEIIL